jgi:large subunit ribosomal protein L10
MLKAQKITYVEELTGKLKNAKSLVLVNYTGLNVKAQQELKNRLDEVGGKMIVIKNTLIKRAGQSADVDPEMLKDSVLQGQTALVVASEDALAPIQVLGKFTKEFETPKFKVGVVEGMFQDEASLTKLSSLPGKDVLLSQVLGSLMSNLYGLVGTLNSPMRQLVYTLDQKAKS